jgi:hypothetical protein
MKDIGLVNLWTCRACGCTDDNCSGCVSRTGFACHWVEADLCSACVDGVAAPADIDRKVPPSPPGGLSPAMTRMLVSLYRGRAPWEHVRNRSMWRGADQTARALRDRGLVADTGPKMILSEAGRACAAMLARRSRRTK